MMVPRLRMFAVHWLVQLGMLLAIVWKWKFFLSADRIYHRSPIQDPFFPAWMQSADVIRWAFCAAVVAIVFNIASWDRWLSLFCTYLTLVCLTILCLHQGSYNDATFATTWWTCLWATWYVHHMNDPDRTFTLRRGAFLSRAIISMILLGGAVGKWTPEYWDGQVMYDIYFEGRNYWTFNLLRSNFEPETLREMAIWYSRKVVVIETLCGFGLWLLPPRWAALVGLTILTSIALFSNFYLFSVMFCLMGLSTVGFFVVGTKQAATSEQPIEQPSEDAIEPSTVDDQP
ncbi:MAG: hypothetical protein HKN47_10065 [Pirellulaceae bacterium]|nr:hypothetical protein [Pirellulaceae bacterium]